MTSPIASEREGCRNCGDEKWVCENHRDRPWDAGHNEGCECGAGAPCPVCCPQMAHAGLIGLLERAGQYIDGMERDRPELIDWDAPRTITDDIDEMVAFYRKGPTQ